MADQPRQLTQDDLAGMTPEQIVAAMEQGICDEIRGVPPEYTALVHKAEHGQITTADLKQLAAIGRHDLINDAHRNGRIVHTNGDAV